MAIVEAPDAKQKVSVQEYLVRERQAEYRSDYVYGDIRAMAGGSLRHGIINSNLNTQVNLRLKGTPCISVPGIVQILVDPNGLYVYPDLTVICDEPVLLDEHQDIVLNPTVVFEVLSPSTARYDRGLKADGYRQIESLQELVFISQTEPLVEQFTRKQDGLWVATSTKGLDGAVVLASIGCTLLLSEIYERVTF